MQKNNNLTTRHFTDRQNVSDVGVTTHKDTSICSCLPAGSRKGRNNQRAFSYARPSNGREDRLAPKHKTARMRAVLLPGHARTSQLTDRQKEEGKRPALAINPKAAVFFLGSSLLVSSLKSKCYAASGGFRLLFCLLCFTYLLQTIC